MTESHYVNSFFKAMVNIYCHIGVTQVKYPDLFGLFDSTHAHNLSKCITKSLHIGKKGLTFTIILFFIFNLFTKRMQM